VTPAVATSTTTSPSTAMPASGEPVLTLAGVAKTWPDGTAAVRRIDLELRRGEFVTLVGPSGCGKSTVLRMVAGLDEATRGRVERPASKPGCVFQQANLLPWRSVARNVELFAELDGVPTADRRRLAAAAITLVGLAGFERHLPHQLSGGMQMRASLARALVTRPELLLFDEPFAAVDELLRERLQEELARLFAAERFAALFITHSVAEAVFLSTKVLVMSPRPGVVAASVDVPFPVPRPADVRFDPEFVALVREVSGVMRRQAVEEVPS
jgi:NitT/TauT family transport system ATP-binding protein